MMIRRRLLVVMPCPPWPPRRNGVTVRYVPLLRHLHRFYEVDVLVIGDEAAVPALVTALESTFTRAEAAAALAKFGSKVVPLLIPLLTGHPDENMRYHVKETLALAGWRAGRV